MPESDKAAAVPGVLRLIGNTPMVEIRRLRGDISPRVLIVRRFGQFSAMLSMEQIRGMLQTPGVTDAAALKRHLYARFSTVLVNLLVLLIALPSFLLREPGNLMLLPDGRVMMGGGGAPGPRNYTDVEYYSPSYLYDGQELADRPVVPLEEGDRILPSSRLRTSLSLSRRHLVPPWSA